MSQGEVPARGRPVRIAPSTHAHAALAPHVMRAYDRSPSTLAHVERRMTTVRLNYDGWLALPAAVRQRLGLVTGDQLEVELAGDAVALRPRRSGGGVDPQAAELAVTTAGPPPPTAPAPPPAAVASPIVKRAPGRPGKSALPVIPPTLKA